MKFTVICLAVLLAPASGQAISKNDWTLQSGVLTYHVKYVLKKVEGVSKSVKGKGHCDEKECEMLVAVPVKSFDSGDGNRDSHMMEVSKGAVHPVISVRVKFPENQKLENLTVDSVVQFAGKEHEYKNIKVHVTGTQAPLQVRGTVPLHLKDFSIDAPKLLGIAIDDLVPVDFDLTWN